MVATARFTLRLLPVGHRPYLVERWTWGLIGLMWFVPLGPPTGQLDWLEAFADRPTVVAKRDGSGPGAQRGDVATFDFVVIAQDGRELANSELRGLPFTMTVGEPGNDPLLDIAVRNLAPGAERELIFPVGTAYTEEGYPPFVPADTPLRVRVKMRALRGR